MIDSSVLQSACLRGAAVPPLVEHNFTPMCLGRNQEEILKLHTLWCRVHGKSYPLAFTEEASNGIAKLHARKMDTNA
jgi:hypothetical protein